MAKGWGCAKKGKRYAFGGFVGAAGTNRGSWSGDGSSLGVRTGTKTGTSASNVVGKGPSIGKAPSPAKKPKAVKPASPPKKGNQPPDLKNRDMSDFDWSGDALPIAGMGGGYGIQGYATDRRMKKGGRVKSK